MKFTTSIYDYKKLESSRNEYIGYGGFLSTALVIIGILFGVLPGNLLMNTMSVMGVLIYSSLKFYSFFAIEAHSKKFEGYIHFGREHIYWNHIPIPWSDISAIDINYSDHNDRLIVPFGHGLNNKRSTGLNNKIKISLHDSRVFESSLYIESKKSEKDLNQVLWQVIKHNNISLENAKRMVYPKNYKEHQELKRYCN